MHELTHIARNTVAWLEAPDLRVQSGQGAIAARPAATS